MKRALGIGARSAWLALLLASFACLSSAQAAQPVVALTESNRLLSFDANSPGTLSASVAITGMQAGESMLGIDFRPATGQLYGLGSTSRLYAIHPVTGVATQVGSGTFGFALSGTAFGFDFNPVVDRIRVVSDTDQNFRIDPNTGSVVDGDPASPGFQADTNLSYAAGDTNAGQNPAIVGSAYTNDFAGATTTTLYGIDSASASNDRFVRQGGVNVPPGTPSPNGGQLFTIGNLGVNSDTNVGLDIAPLSGTAYASLTSGGVSQLYTVTVNTGATAFIGTIGDGTLDVRGLALPAISPTLYAVTNSNQLHKVKAAVPATPIATVSVTGMQGGEGLVGIDFRPTTGGLYGLGSTGRLYTIDLLTGVATQVGNPFTLSGNGFGFAFDPLTDRIRVVSDNEQNLSINPDTGSVVNDPQIPGMGNAVVAAAYTNDIAGASSTELFGIDFNFNTLVKISNPSGSPTIASIGALGVPTNQRNAFDFTPGENLALAALEVGALANLYVVNTTTGAATFVGGTIAGASQILGIAIAPVGRFGVANSEVAENAGTATVTVTRTAGSSGSASVDYAATAGSATDGSDFTAVSGTLLWADGETSKTFSVPILDDSTFEGDETVNLALSNPLQGASLLAGTGTLTIKENESAPPGSGPGPGTDPGTDPGADPGSGPGADLAPTITQLDMTNRRFAVRPAGQARTALKRGTKFLFTLSEAAQVRVAIHRIKPGRRVNGRCVKPRPRFRDRPRCKRFIGKGSLSDAGEAGANRLPFSGRLRGKPLRPGRYRATLVATDAAGQKSSPKRIRFRIVRG